MNVADELCDALFRWIDLQKKCADNLMALATELENMREKMTTGQLVGNTATVLGSAALVSSGIATFLTGGLAVPLLVAAAGFTAGAGTVTSVTFSLVEKWKSSSTMKNAEMTADRTKHIQNEIESLQKKLQEECERKIMRASSSDDVHCEITARILKAMAKRSGRDLSVSDLRHLLRSGGMDTQNRYPGFNLDVEFFKKVGCLLAVLGLSATLIVFKTAATKGQKYIVPLVVTATEEMVSLSLKTELKGTGQVAGGIFGLLFAVPDLVNNCQELIENKHQTEASTSLKTKAKEISEAVIKLQNNLEELKVMLKQIPEMECHIDLSQEMFGSQIYTRGTICMEYTQTEEQDRKTQKFILLCTKNIEVTEHGSTGKDESGDKKNKRQKAAVTSTEDSRRTLNLNQQKQPDQEKSPNKSKTNVFNFCLPTILLTNVRSLPKKIEELKKMLKKLKNVGLICITETWYNDNSPDLHQDGFQVVRVDRDAWLTGRRRGGGLMMIVNSAWATDVQVELLLNTEDYELMVVSIIPHDHTEGAPPLTFIQVYIPPKAKKTKAAKDIADIYDAFKIKYHGGPVFLLGDFNHCKMDFLGLEQYVKCPTRKQNILDKCYGNVPGAYNCKCRSPLGSSDHNVIFLIPKDKSDESDPSKDEKCTHEKTKSKKK